MASTPNPPPDGTGGVSASGFGNPNPGGGNDVRLAGSNIGFATDPDPVDFGGGGDFGSTDGSYGEPKPEPEPPGIFSVHVGDTVTHYASALDAFTAMLTQMSLSSEGKVCISWNKNSWGPTPDFGGRSGGGGVRPTGGRHGGGAK